MPTNRSAIEETYKDIKGILRAACWKIYSTYPNCEMDELMAEANYIYVRYFDAHPPHYDFGLWIYFKVLYCLIDKKRVEWKRSQKVGMLVYHAMDFAESYSIDWTDDLVGEDFDVVRLVLRLPKTSKSALEDSLENLGWEPAQIMQSFSRIRESINGH